MADLINGNGSAGHFGAAYSTVNYAIVATEATACRENLVFLNRIAAAVGYVIRYLVTRAGYLVEADGIALDIGGNINSKHFSGNAVKVKGEILRAPSLGGGYSVRAVFFSRAIENGLPNSVNVSVDSKVRTEVARVGGVRLCLRAEVVNAKLVKLVYAVKIYGSVNVLSLRRRYSGESTALRSVGIISNDRVSVVVGRIHVNLFRRRLGRNEGLAKQEVGKVIIYLMIHGSRALDLVYGDRVGAESCGNVNAHLLRSDTAEVKGKINAIQTVSYYLVVGGTADHRSPLAERINLYLERGAHKGCGSSRRIKVVYLKLVKEITAAKIDNTVEHLLFISRLSGKASCLIVSIIVGELGIVVVYAHAAVSAYEEGSSEVTLNEGLALEYVSNAIDNAGALDLVYRNTVGTESRRYVNTDLLRLYAREVKGKIISALAVRDYLIVRGTAYNGSPFALGIHLNLESRAHKGGSGGCRIKVIDL